MPAVIVHKNEHAQGRFDFYLPHPGPKQLWDYITESSAVPAFYAFALKKAGGVPGSGNVHLTQRDHFITYHRKVRYVEESKPASLWPKSSKHAKSCLLQ